MLGPVLHAAGYQNVYEKVEVKKGIVSNCSVLDKKSKNDICLNSALNDAELNRATIKVKAVQHRRMSNKLRRQSKIKHNESLKQKSNEEDNNDKNISKNKEQETKGDTNGNANKLLSTSDLTIESPSPISPKLQKYDPKWNVPANGVKKYRKFLKQYITKNAGGEGFEPHSERGLIKWNINYRDPTFNLLRKILLGDAPPQTVDPTNGLNALHLACLSGSYKAVEKILSIGMNHPLTPTKDKAGTMQAIHFACRNYLDNGSILNTLLAKYLPFIRKARKDVKNNGDAAVVVLGISDADGRNSLHISALYSNVQVFKEIIKTAKSAPTQGKSHSFFRSKDKHGRTALHYAMFRSNLAIVKLCIEELQLTFTSKDKMRRSPLHYIALGTKTKHGDQMELLKYIYNHIPARQRKLILNEKSIAGYSPIAKNFGLMLKNKRKFLL
eukprot:g7624.t1